MLAYATLLHLQARYPDLLSIVAEWLSSRTQQPWNARRVLEAEVWRHPQIEVRTALAQRSEQTVWVMQVNTRDSRVIGRDWRLELALQDREQGGVLASIVVHALDSQRFGRAAAPVPFSQPTLVRSLLESGVPAPDTPGLHPVPMDTEADALGLVERINTPDRSHGLLVLCRGEAPLNVATLRAGLTGVADLVELRPVLPQDVTLVLRPASAWPTPGRATFFPPANQGAASNGRRQRLVLAAEMRTLTSTVFRFGAPRVLSEHLTLERLHGIVSRNPAKVGDTESVFEDS